MERSLWSLTVMGKANDIRETLENRLVTRDTKLHKILLHKICVSYPIVLVRF